MWADVRVCRCGCAGLEHGRKALARVLVLDKDPLQLELLCFLLKQEGHEVHATPEPDILFDILRSKSVDLVLVETALPSYDGEKLCSQVRHLSSQVAFMIVSERDREEQIVRGLLCADEYITKPFSPRQLLARVNALPEPIVPGGSEEIPLLLAVGRKLARLPARRGGCLVFDSGRHASMKAGALDNRYALGEEDAPSVEHLGEMGIRRVRAWTWDAPGDDLSAYLGYLRARLPVAVLARERTAV